MDWEHHLANANHDPHKVIHEHLQGIYSSEETVKETPPELPFEEITMDELRYAVHLGKNNVSVSHDGASRELLVGIMQSTGGPEAMLIWFNNLLRTGALPENWYRSLMVVLPKTALPTLPKELRPISMSSAISKTFCRLVLGRSKRHIRPWGHASARAPPTNSWKAGFSRLRYYLKVDLEKAFDLVSRPALLEFLESKLGRSHELRIGNFCFLGRQPRWKHLGGY